MEAKTLRTNTLALTTKFIYECILTRFGCPLTIVTYQGVHFINDAIKYLTYHFLLKHVSFTTHYPEENGQVESTNKILGTLLTKLVEIKLIGMSIHIQCYFHIDYIQSNNRVYTILISVWIASIDAYKVHSASC